MIDFDEITACLVTRGDVAMEPVVEALPAFADVLIWDNSLRPNLRTFGRFEMTKYIDTDYVYFQDDDLIFRHHAELLAALNETPDQMVTNDAHGGNYAGYEDLGWTGAGAIVPISVITRAWAQWFHRHPDSVSDEWFLYEADAVFGILAAPFRYVELPYERLYADDDTRLCRQPWQEDKKLHMATLARAIRDDLR